MNLFSLIHRRSETLKDDLKKHVLRGVSPIKGEWQGWKMLARWANIPYKYKTAVYFISRKLFTLQVYNWWLAG
jgi:hypothetical protein